MKIKSEDILKKFIKKDTMIMEMEEMKAFAQLILDINKKLDKLVCEDDEYEPFVEEEQVDTLKEISKLQSEIDLLRNDINQHHSMIHSAGDRSIYLKEQLYKLMSEVRRKNE